MHKDILLFDGVCNLCNHAVNFIIDRDPEKKILFLSLQSSKAIPLLAPFGIDPLELNSLVLISGAKCYTGSGAVLQVAIRLRFPWPLAIIFFSVPPFIRDFLYEFVARHRYQWFGKRSSCRVPTQDIKDRFLEAD